MDWLSQSFSGWRSDILEWANGALSRPLQFGVMVNLFGYLSQYVYRFYLKTVLTSRNTKVLCVIPVPLLRWALVALAFGFSGWFLAANIYPILATVRYLLFACTPLLIKNFD